MKRIGLLALALVLALGALGVGYAAWTDQVTIEGTVKTGTLSLDVVGYSGTHVYKTADDGVHVERWQNEDGSHPEGDFGELIGWAGARPGDPTADEKDVVVTFHNIFPCVEFEANVKLHCFGTVPIEVKAELMPLDEATEALMTEILAGEGGKVEVRAYLWNSIKDPDGSEAIMVDPTNFIQMHNCDVLKLVLMIYLPQVDALQGRTGSFYVDINAIQFNKVGEYDDYFPGPLA